MDGPELTQLHGLLPIFSKASLSLVSILCEVLWKTLSSVDLGCSPQELAHFEESQGILDFLKLNEDKCFVQCIANIQWHITNLYFLKSSKPG